jgi:hypothetical protein
MRLAQHERKGNDEQLITEIIVNVQESSRANLRDSVPW